MPSDNMHAQRLLLRCPADMHTCVLVGFQLALGCLV